MRVVSCTWEEGGRASCGRVVFNVYLNAVVHQQRVCVKGDTNDIQTVHIFCRLLCVCEQICLLQKAHLLRQPLHLVHMDHCTHPVDHWRC